MRVLITGATGFCGRHLVKYLIKQNLEVYTLGRQKSEYQYHCLISNPCDIHKLTELIHKTSPKYVLHLAGVMHTSEPSIYYQINTSYAATLMDSLEICGLREVPVLLIGSGAEYGYVSANELPIKETQPEMPYNHYGISKLAQTFIGRKAILEGRSVVIARPFNIIGPGMSEKLSIGSFIAQVIRIRRGEQKKIIRTGNISTTRDFIDIEDIVKIYWELIQNPKAYGKVINICRGIGIKISEVLDALIEETGMQIMYEQEELRIKENDITQHYGDNSRLIEIIGNRPFISYRETLRRMIDQDEKENINNN